MATAATKTETATRTVTKLGPFKIGPAIDQLSTLREQKRELMAKVEAIEADYALLEVQLMAKLEAEGSDKGTGKFASVTVSRSVVPNVIDWDSFHAFIAKHKYFHLLQKRTSDAAVRELFDLGKKVPGVEPFTKSRLNLRAL